MKYRQAYTLRKGQEMANTSDYVGLPSTLVNTRTVVYKWEFDSNGNGSSFEVSGFTKQSVQCAGTWDTATVTWQGSIDGTNWRTLTDSAANNLAFTTNGGPTEVLQMCRYVRPVLSSAGASTDVDAYLMAVEV